MKHFSRFVFLVVETRPQEQFPSCGWILKCTVAESTVDGTGRSGRSWPVPNGGVERHPERTDNSCTVAGVPSECNSLRGRGLCHVDVFLRCPVGVPSHGASRGPREPCAGAPVGGRWGPPWLRRQRGFSHRR